jgi:GntR family transcriptional regulator
MARPPAKAQSITDTIAAKIVSGEFEPDAWLPAERELAEEYNADRSTVRRALRMLAERGLVVHEPGVGTQVRRTEPVRRDQTGDLTQQEGAWRGFHVSAMRAGREPYTNTTVQEMPTDASLARWLGVPIGTTVLQRARVQGVVGEPPVQTATTWVLLDVVEQIPVLRQVNTGPGGIYSRLADHRIYVRFEESVTCRLPTQAERETLDIEASQPVLITWRRGYDQDNRIVEVTHRVIVGDRHELVYTYGPTR